MLQYRLVGGRGVSMFEGENMMKITRVPVECWGWKGESVIG